MASTSKINKIAITGVLIMLSLLSACEDGGHFLFSDPYDYLSQEPTTARYPVFIESEPVLLAMYEPAYGSFIGLYTDTLPRPDGRVIAEVESALGVSHDTFMEVIRLGDSFPTLWVLECIAEQKIPVIVILPPETGNPFGNRWEDILTETAMAFSEFPVPMFVVLYPIGPSWAPADAATYIAFFRYARAIFAQHAPHVAFIWSVDADMKDFSDNFMNYFPGRLAVDWVGLSLFASSCEPIEIPVDFYYAFQHDFPIMLNIGISHFSTTDHRYRIAETAATLEKVYHTILTDFPRVKMINYMDISRFEYNGRDYRISQDPGLRIAYLDSIQGFSPPSGGLDSASIPIRSAYNAFVEEGRIYLDVRILEEMGKPVPGQTRWIDGARRVDMSLLELSAEVGERRIVLQR